MKVLDWLALRFSGLRSPRHLGARAPLGHPPHTRDPRGQSAIIVALAMVGILAFAGFAVDTGIIMLHRVWLGQAADAASLAAGYELPNARAACMRAVEYILANGYEPGPDFSFQIIFPAEPESPVGDPGEFIIDSVADNIQDSSDCLPGSLAIPAEHRMSHYSVEVSATQTVPVSLMAILGFGEVAVSVPARAQRTARFDVALVLDNSGSMEFDSCKLYRPEDNYGCENRFAPCTSFYQEDFTGYTVEQDLVDSGWEINDQVFLLTTDGHNSPPSVKLHFDGSDEGFISRNVDTTGQHDVALFMWAKKSHMGNGDELQMYWRPDSGAGWTKISQFEEIELTDVYKHFAVLLPSAADDNPNNEIAFKAEPLAGHSFYLDEIELKSCPLRSGPWLWYFRDGNIRNEPEGCRADRPMTCDMDDPELMLPGIAETSTDPPVSQFMEQPMTDVLESTAYFIQILDSRRLPGQPREDRIGLATFTDSAVLLHNLSTDYESVKDTLMTSIRARLSTNIGDGMRTGLSILADGRSNSRHYMILLTDGWPNHYDTPYDNPTRFDRECDPYGPCKETLEYIDVQANLAASQNVTIFCIGLGTSLTTEIFDASPAYGPGTESFTGMDLLDRIANTTGGQAYNAPTTEELQVIFGWIAEAIFVRLTK